MLRAIIFDMDGVLVDSEPLHKRACELALACHGISLPADYGRNFIGTTVLHMFEVIVSDLGLTETPGELTDSYQEKLEELVRKEGYAPIPGVKEWIWDLRRNGVRLAVASSSTLKEIEENTERCGIREAFDELVSGTDLERPKPAPDIFLEAARRLKAEPCECLVVEDSMYGTMAAKAAGMACIGFRNPNSGNQDLSQADLLLLGFEEADYELALWTWCRGQGEPVTIAQGERVLLRELSDADVPELYEIYREPQVRRFVREMNGSLPEELERHQAYREGAYRFYGFGIWGIFLKENGRLIGSCGLECGKIWENDASDANKDRQETDPGRMELGYVLSGPFTGRGYAAEAAGLALEFGWEKLGCESISAVIEEENAGSVRVAERLGMERKERFLRNGKPFLRYEKRRPGEESGRER